jgi:hypothetical protein
MPVSITISDLRSLIKEVIQEKQQPIIESSYSQIMNVVRGQKESIYQFGIMTAENPRGKAADASFNNNANAELEAELQRRGYGYSGIGGKFGGSKENSFLIRNIPYHEMVELGYKFKQEAVIFATKKKDDPFMTFIYVDTTTPSGTIGDKKEVVLSDENVQSREDFYSSVGMGDKEKKFLIPFFDDGYNTKRFTNAGRTIGDKS